MRGNRPSQARVQLFGAGVLIQIPEAMPSEWTDEGVRPEYLITQPVLGRCPGLTPRPQNRQSPQTALLVLKSGPKRV